MTGATDPWTAVIGQHEAVHRLRAAVEEPVHAYLFVGPGGLGKLTAAAVFAGELLATADTASAERHRRLAARLEHPDVAVLTPTGNQFRLPESKELIRLASLAPVEGRRKVLIAVRFHDAEAPAMPPLLKIVEEPPPSTIFVFLADQIRPEHATIASRCTEINFSPVGSEVLQAALVAEGVAPSSATAAAAAADGRIERARMMARDARVEARRQAWRSIPDRLDGSGATVHLLVEEIRELIEAATDSLRAIHAEEMEEIERREEQVGRRGSGRKEQEEHHKRVERRFRTEEIRFGLATLAARYRESISAADTRPLAAVDRLRRTSDALIRNPNEALLLQAMLLDLPPAPAPA